MIGKLRGTVDSVEEGSCVIDVGGVGYDVHCSATTLAALPAPGEGTTLAVETVVREDMIRLYGFATKGEREWFRLLQANVQGVGAKMALSLLSALSPDGLAAAIARKDLAALSKAQGVGRKVAERIAQEMQGKCPDASGAPPGAAPAVAKLFEDAAAALEALGYDRAASRRAVAAATASRDGPATLGDVIKECIRALARG